MHQDVEDLPIAFIGDDEWRLPPQIKLLESWIDSNAVNLTTGEYIADIGFCWRRDAGGGGSALSRELLAKMGIAGFTLFLSEYPGFGDDEDKS